MLDFLKKFFSKNLLLKAFSLTLAFFLWLMVVNQEDPIGTETVNNIPITVLHEEYFEELGKHVTLESEMTLNITVSGRRSVIEQLEPEDFQATIDYLSVKPEEGRAEILCTALNRSVTITRQSSAYIKLSVEDVITKDLPIVLYTEGTPADGYLVVHNDSYVIMEPAEVTIKGPQSQVNSIVSAAVVVDVEGALKDVSGKGKMIEFRDAEGNSVNLDELEDVTYEHRMMSQLSVPVYKTAKIPIKLPEVIEDEDSDYYVEGSSMSETTVTIYGPERILGQIQELTLSSVMTKGKTETFRQTYDLESVCAQLSLQYGVRIGLTEGSPSEATLTVILKEKEVKSVSLAEYNYSYQNLAEGKECVLETGPQILKLKGSASALQNITAANIRVKLDLGQCTEDGSYEVKPVYELPAGIRLVDAPEKISVSIRSQEEQSEE